MSMLIPILYVRIIQVIGKADIILKTFHFIADALPYPIDGFVLEIISFFHVPMFLFESPIVVGHIQSPLRTAIVIFHRQKVLPEKAMGRIACLKRNIAARFPSSCHEVKHCTQPLLAVTATRIFDILDTENIFRQDRHEFVRRHFDAVDARLDVPSVTDRHRLHDRVDIQTRDV